MFRNTILLALLVAASCAKKPPEARNLEVSLAGLVSNSQITRALVRVVNPTTGVATVHELTSKPFVVLIADGTWNIQMVGFVGGVNWSGTVECWSANGMVLASTTTNVYLTGSHGVNCAAEPLATLVSSKSSRFDIAKWDGNGKWAP